MPIDWATVAANNRQTEQAQRDREAIEGIRRGNSTLAADEAAWLHQRRQEEAARTEEAAHKAELAEFFGFVNRQIAQLGKPGRENPRTAAEWERIGKEIARGHWPSDSFVLQADSVACLKFQALRSRLGKAAVESPDRPRQVKIANSMFVWQ